MRSETTLVWIVFEIVFALSVPTEISHVELTLEATWTPFAETSENLFTGRTADDLDEDRVTDNPVELEAEARAIECRTRPEWCPNGGGFPVRSSIAGGGPVADPGTESSP